MKVTVYTQSGEKKGEATLNKELFEAPINVGLMHQASVRQSSNARVDTAFTLVKGEVRGGGRKPTPQKGRGRSRQGSIRAPQYMGGGVIFGPRGNRNYEKMMPKKMRRSALFSALSLKAKEKEMVVVDEFKTKEPKTQLFMEMLQKLSVKPRVLVVLPEGSEAVEKSMRNIENLRYVTVPYLNITDLLWSETVLFFEPSLKKAEEVFL